MKADKKTLILTTLICLLPAAVGAAVYSRLPETMATHWSLDGTPDGWSSRAFTVFGLPALLAGLNLLMYFGLSMVLRPLSVVGDVVPFIGTGDWKSIREKTSSTPNTSDSSDSQNLL